MGREKQTPIMTSGCRNMEHEFKMEVGRKLSMSQQSKAIILQPARQRNALTRASLARALKQLVLWAWARHSLESSIQFEIQKGRDKENWKGMRENQQQTLKVWIQRPIRDWNSWRSICKRWIPYRLNVFQKFGIDWGDSDSLLGSIAAC